MINKPNQAIMGPVCVPACVYFGASLDLDGHRKEKSSRLITCASLEKLRERKKLSEILTSLDLSISAMKFKKTSSFFLYFA